MSDSVETLWAVVIGALLATVGGFAATRLEEILRRRERERAAALLFGEILSALELITTFADEARQLGDPFGPVTMRLLRAARRETDVYDRNRESLYDLRDATLRAKIHTLMVQATMSLDGVFDMTDQIALAQSAARGLAVDDPALVEVMASIERMVDARQTGFDFVMERISQTKQVVAGLRPLAKQAFEAQATVAREF